MKLGGGIGGFFGLSFFEVRFGLGGEIRYRLRESFLGVEEFGLDFSY